MHLPLHNHPTETRSTKTHFDVLDHGEPDSGVEIFDISPKSGSTTCRGLGPDRSSDPQPDPTLAVAQMTMFTAAKNRGSGSPILARSVLTETQEKKTVAVDH